MNLNNNQKALLIAMVAGHKFKVRHGMTAPYAHGYYVQSDEIKDYYCQPVTCTENWHENLPIRLEKYLIEKGWTDKDFDKLTQDANKVYQNQLNLTPDMYEPIRRVATGYEITDSKTYAKILKGEYDGTYNTMTTVSQNDLSAQLIFLRGHANGMKLPVFEKVKDALSYMPTHLKSTNDER